MSRVNFLSRQFHKSNLWGMENQTNSKTIFITSLLRAPALKPINWPRKQYIPSTDSSPILQIGPRITTYSLDGLAH